MYPMLARSETIVYVTPIISQADQSTLAYLTLNPYLTLTPAWWFCSDQTFMLSSPSEDTY